MAEAWPHFATTLANCEQVLAKSDMQIAARYGVLVEDQALARAPSLARSATGWERTARRAARRRPGRPACSNTHPKLDAAIRLRLPYIEPLNLLQIELLKRHRAGENDPRVAEGILLTINAIATALGIG